MFLEGMNKLTFYGPANLIGTIFLIIFLLISLKKYGNKEDYYEKIKPIRFMFWFLTILEIGKIIYHIAHNGSWNPKAFPIIYSSLGMYVYAIIAYGKKNSIPVRVSFITTVFPYLFVGIPYWFVFPTMNWGKITLFGYIMNIHSRLYHFALLAVAFYVLKTKLYTFPFKDWFPAAVANGLYFLFCTVTSLFIGGEISNFGPKSNEAKFIYDRFGYAPGNLILIFVAFVGGFIIFKLIDIIRQKKKAETNKLEPNIAK